MLQIVICFYFQLPDVTAEEHEDYKEQSDCDSLSDDELKKGYALITVDIQHEHYFHS